MRIICTILELCIGNINVAYFSCHLDAKEDGGQIEQQTLLLADRAGNTNQFHICLIFFVDCFRLLTDGNGPDYGYNNNYGDDNVYDYGNDNGYGDYNGYGNDNGYGNVYLFQ
jgi:hypothetical protein